MIAEVLVVLAGHPSSFFVPSPPPPSSAKCLKLATTLAELLHPGETSALETLGLLAFRYQYARTWAHRVREETRSAILAQSLNEKGKQRADDNDSPSIYLATLASSVLEVLKGYELLIVETEAKVLDLDPGVVQDDHGYVPLASLVAIFDEWQPVLAALFHLVSEISSTSDSKPWTPARFQEHLTHLRDTGNPRLRQIYTELLRGIHQLFLTHLIAFLLYGYAPPSSTPTAPALGVDAGPDPSSPQHRLYTLNGDLLPADISRVTRDSILYIGRVAATLKREGRSFPGRIVDDLRQEMMKIEEFTEKGALDGAIKRARTEIGEWLWKNVLTGPQVIGALETFGDYFLLRKADFATSILIEFHQLYHTKLLTGNAKSSSSVIREVDLNVAMARASVGTSSEIDPSIEKLGWKLENGPLRPIMPFIQPQSAGEPTSIKSDNFIRDSFGSMVLGTPLEMKIRIGWPLDLFLTPTAATAYSDIHSYLFALKDVHGQLIDTWTSLTAADRLHQSSRGQQRDEPTAIALHRAVWGTLRAMLFFLDQLLAHFMTDIIDVQHQRLLGELESVGLDELSRLPRSESGVSPSTSLRGSLRHQASMKSMDSRTLSTARGIRPESPTSDVSPTATTSRLGRPPTPGATPKTHLDFLTLRQMHSRHLSFLQEGLLLADQPIASLVRDVMLVCKRFFGTIHRWNGHIVPPPLSEGYDTLIAERAEALREVSENFNEHLSDFFRALIESQNPVLSKDDASSTGTGGTSFSRTARTMQMSRLMSRHASFSLTSKAAQTRANGKLAGDKSAKDAEADGMISRHVEQLLLRLDFNGVLTAWITSEDEDVQSKNVLAEGGLE